MSIDSFAEHIRMTAEASREAVLKAQEEERRLQEERHIEKEKRKTECIRICHKIFQPAMASFAAGLEAAKVFAARAWEVNCITEEDKYYCIFGAQTPKMEPSGKIIGFVVKTALTLSLAEGRPPQLQVQVRCYQASPKEDWKETKPMELPAPTDEIGDLFVDDLWNLDSARLDAWHKGKLDDCAQVCSKWIFLHASKVHEG